MQIFSTEINQKEINYMHKAYIDKETTRERDNRLLRRTRKS